MADRYLNYLLSKSPQRDSLLALSNSPFVAVGAEMQWIWQSVLRHRRNGQVVAVDGYPNLRFCPTSRDDQPTETREISTVKWLPGEDDPFPNPWLDASSLLPANNWEQQAQRFPLSSLPPELIVHLATFLPRESAIALALTNKTMYCLISHRPFHTKEIVRFHMTISERWNLLLLLERDSNLLGVCQECTKLHGPLPRAGLACVERRTAFLPGDITPVFCRLLAKHYLHQRNYTDLLSIANRTQTLIQSDFKLLTTVTYHLRAGNLFVRHETFIAPLSIQGNLTSRGAYLLNRAVDSERARACPHVRWQHLGLELSCGAASGIHYPSSLSAHHLGTQLSGDPDGLSGNDLLQQVARMDNSRLLEFSRDCRYSAANCDGRFPYQHYHMLSGCYDSTVIPQTVLDSGFGPGLRCALLHSQPCRECDKWPSRFRVGLVRACEICTTDMCVSAQDVKGIGRVMALTTWKNLGGVHVGEWASWYPHYWNVYRFSSRFPGQPEDDIVMRDLSKGTAVYAAFHNLSVDTTESVRWYTPLVSRRMLDAFGEGSHGLEKFGKLPELLFGKAPGPLVYFR